MDFVTAIRSRPRRWCGVPCAPLQACPHEPSPMDWFESSAKTSWSGGMPGTTSSAVRELPRGSARVSLSIGSTDALDERYLARLKVLVDEIDPPCSRTTCAGRRFGRPLHDLLPMPSPGKPSRTSLARERTQDILERPSPSRTCRATSPSRRARCPMGVPVRVAEKSDRHPARLHNI